MSSPERLRLMRKKEGLSQARFAKEIGFSQSYVKNIETGRAKPSRRMLEAISKRFGISVDWLLQGIEGAPAKQPRYPGVRDVLLIAYEGSNRDRVEGLLKEGEYTLFERLVLTNSVLAYLDAATEDLQLQGLVVRTYLTLRGEPTFKNDDLFISLEQYLDDIPKLKSLAILAFSGGPQALFEFFYQFLSFGLEYWDFDFDTFTLNIQLYHRESRSIPLLLSQPYLLSSDENFEIGERLTEAVIRSIEEIDDSMNEEQRKTLYGILKGGVEIIVRRAVEEYLKTKGSS